MRAAADPVQCNSDGLESFAAGDPAAAEHLLRQSFQGIPDERGILVNLGLALMQQSKVDQAERCYRLALSSDEQRVRRSAAKTLAFCCSGVAITKKVGTGMAVALKANHSQQASGAVIH